MSYLGKVALKASDIRRLDVTSSTSATHTLTWTPPSEQSLIITINGVKQQNNYSISGVTLTLDTALVATDEMEVIGINDIGTTTVPGDGTVTTTKIEDDAVTADKLANAINTSIAANTAKVTNATHTGDVTGATALTIASGAVDLAMLSATGTADATTFLRGDNAWAAVAGGLSDASQWRLTSNFAGDADPIASNLAVVDSDGYGSLGSAMTESSGIFTFPSTGYWLIICQYSARYDAVGASGYAMFKTQTTVNDGTYGDAAIIYTTFESGTDYSSTNGQFLFDVTSTSTHKVRFRVDQSNTSNVTLGDGSKNMTAMTFMKLGAT